MMKANTNYFLHKIDNKHLFIENNCKDKKNNNKMQPFSKKNV